MTGPAFSKAPRLNHVAMSVPADSLDADGFERALELLASGDLRTDLLIDPVDVPLRGLRDAMVALVDGRLAGKVMVAPALDGAPDGEAER